MQAISIVLFALIFIVSIIKKLGGSASRFLMLASAIIAGLAALGVVVLALLLFVDMLSTM
jgi:hypothetical protein